MTQPRIITRAYQDPLDVIWLSTAKRLGMHVTRSRDVFAAWDGKGTLSIGAADDLDADDCLAQMILHEICHALVQGEENFSKQNWGLTNTDNSDTVREHACIRLQAALSQPFGLRGFMAITTDWRWYHNELPHDPLSGEQDPASKLASQGYRRSQLEPWAKALNQALRATQCVVEATGSFAGEDSLFATYQGA